MPRPNISQGQIISLLKANEGAFVNMNTVLEHSEFSEVTVRASIKQLLSNGTIEVNKESKPYSYRIKETV